MAWLSDSEKKFYDMLIAVSTEYRRVTDTRTYRQTDGHLST